MLSDDEIFKIARDQGMGMGIHPPMRLVDQGNGFLKFKEPEELTYYGSMLLAFTREIERQVKGEQ